MKYSLKTTFSFCLPNFFLLIIIINSLIHCDYISDTEHQITIDPTKLEIYNPGIFGEYSPIDYIENFIPSKTKHKVIQGIVYKAFDIETLGTAGFIKWVCIVLGAFVGVGLIYYLIDRYLSKKTLKEI